MPAPDSDNGGDDAAEEVVRRAVAHSAPGSQDTDIPPPVPEGFAPPRVMDTLGNEGREAFRESFGDRETPTQGATGLYVEEFNLMIADPRSKSHHNQQFRALFSRSEQYPHIEPGLQNVTRLMPWASASNMTGEMYLDVPESAGGLYQAIANYDVGDRLARVSYGHMVDAPEYLYETAYTAYLLNHPGETRVTYRFNDPSSVERTYSTSEEYRLADLYAELRFAGVSLPEPYLG
jgi:hypothetical protein